MSPVQSLRQHLPNLLTLCNLALGFLSVLMAFENQLLFASWLILLAALFDFLDGFAAKLLRAVSDLGKQLDSLADIISFGMAPAAIVYKLMEYALRNGYTITAMTETSLGFIDLLVDNLTAGRRRTKAMMVRTSPTTMSSLPISSRDIPR